MSTLFRFLSRSPWLKWISVESFTEALQDDALGEVISLESNWVTSADLLAKFSPT